MVGSVAPRADPLRPAYSITSAVIVRNRMLADTLASRSRMVRQRRHHISRPLQEGAVERLSPPPHRRQFADVPAGSTSRCGSPSDSAALIRARLLWPVFRDVFSLPRMYGAVRPPLTYSRWMVSSPYPRSTRLRPSRGPPGERRYGYGCGTCPTPSPDILL